MSSAQALQALLRQGGEIDTPASQEAVMQAATETGLTALVVDCDRARSRSAVLRAVAKAVDFPEFFGSNLDALYDCLSDTVMDQRDGLFLWFHRLHTGDPILGDDARAVLQVCQDVVEFAENNGRVFSYVVEHAGKHPDPVVEQPVSQPDDD
ncbi:MAG TPA: barstar family protein [Burkholderiaceae bacterium]|nr:barstar family protein [Burkholderiaceae bacterium]